jgi:uncharacterized protein YggL (DUF469 family)
MWHRKRRVRKKRKIGEFGQLGFGFKGEFADPRLAPSSMDSLVEHFIEFFESHDMSCSGFWSPSRFSGVVTKVRQVRRHGRLRYDDDTCDALDIDDVDAFLHHLQLSGFVKRWFVTSLTDVNYGDWEGFCDS